MQVDKVLEDIEKTSEVFVEWPAKKILGEKITIFNNDIYTAETLEEKISVLKNIEQIIESLEEDYYPSIAIEAALAYIKCGGDDE